MNQILKLLIPLGSLLLCSFVPSKNNIKLVDAKYENWTSGVNGGGSGKEYFFKVKVLSENKIIFDSLWIHNQSYKTYLANNRKYVSSDPIVFSKNDTIVVRVSELNQDENTKIVKSPIHYRGEALLRYFVNGKAYFLTVKSIQLIRSPNRP